MRLLTLLFALTTAAEEKPGLEKLQWIAGNWTGAIGRATVEETWLTPGGGAMLGVSRTVAGPRMVAFEFLRIVQKDAEIYYIAQPQGRPPTEFKLTSATATRAIFENPKHDHPKMITTKRILTVTYWRQLKATNKGSTKNNSSFFTAPHADNGNPALDYGSGAVAHP
jgi:hypothetical protein